MCRENPILAPNFVFLSTSTCVNGWHPTTTSSRSSVDDNDGDSYSGLSSFDEDEGADSDELDYSVFNML